MRRIYLLTAFIFIGITYAKAQCPKSTLTIDNQKEIDNFSFTYPNCEEMTKALVITGSVTNLNGLSAIKKYNTFTIYNTFQLTTINGSSAIESLNGLYIFSNTALQTIGGFDSLMDLQNELLIESNPNLTDIHAFSKINNEVKSINIAENFNLKRIVGFDSVKQISNSLKVSNSPSLTEINAFNSLRKNLGRMVFSNIQTDPMPNLVNLYFNQYLLLNQINFEQIYFAKKDFFYNPQYDFDTLLITNCQTNKIIGHSSIEGMVNFRFSYVEITNNPKLDSIDALLGIGFGLKVENNPNLTSIKNFAYNFVDVGNPDPEYKFIIIRNNNLLNDLSKFNFNPKALDKLEIINNPALLSVAFIKKIVSIKNGVISNNKLLDSLFFRPYGFTLDGTLTIDKNVNLKHIDFSGMKKCEYATVSVSNNKSLQTINFTSYKIDKFNSLTLINNDVLNNIELDVQAINNLTLQRNGQWDSINGFNDVQHITNLFIINNASLKAINGFKQLETVYNLSIELNSQLQSLAGFNHVNTIREGEMRIINNDNLLDLHNFKSLSKIYGGLFVSSNEQLRTLFKDKNQLTLLNGNVNVHENDALTDLNGLASIDLNELQTRILENKNLSYCNYANVCNALNNRADIIIDGNNRNCRSNQEVLDQCTNNLNHPVYPNPANNTLYFNTISNDVQMKITVYDMYGRIVNYYEQKVPRIDISALANGSYVVDVRSDQLNFKQKFVKY